MPTKEIIQKGRLGIYIHWPFCVSKCPYCDFNVYTSAIQEPDRWLNAYLNALDFYADKMTDRDVVSLYFGGGTPSLMEPDHVQAIIERVKKRWVCMPDIEITLEANPTSSEVEKLSVLSLLASTVFPLAYNLYKRML